MVHSYGLGNKSQVFKALTVRKNPIANRATERATCIVEVAAREARVNAQACLSLHELARQPQVSAWRPKVLDVQSPDKVFVIPA